MKRKQETRTRGAAMGFLYLVALGLACTVALAEQKSVGEDAPPPGDPFAFRGTGMEDGFVSVTPTALPTGIRVVGILTPREGKSVGVLDIPGAGALHFVREGDIIQVEPATVTRRVTPVRDERRGRDAEPGSVTQPQSFTPSSGTPVYLLIVSIGENQIEIAPRARPQDTRIYR